ncbi:AGE family epimerase/isomerase [Synoicihabitans lomoniglobus]|nr:AGE family epimerase/isomerase [Opitutaceae bacterium LMO-M01]
MKHEAAGREAIRSIRSNDTGAMARWLREHLFDHILPFWEKAGGNLEAGLPTCIADDGTLLSSDRWLWSQWRAVWVFARIYNSLDRDPKWLERARRVAAFSCQYGWLSEEKGWALLLDESGAVKRGYESVYVDAFAVYGLTELAVASGESVWLERARETADAAMRRCQQWGDRVPHFPYPIPPGAKPHGLPMIWSLKLAGLGQVTGEPLYAEMAQGMLAEIDRDFYRTEEDRLFETVSRDGSRYPGAPGSVTVPGHAIEGMWFQRLVAHELGDAPISMAETWRRVRRHLELGWDPAGGGGLLLAVDGSGPASTAGWAFGDTKLWWPHTEALFAALLGWHETGESSWLDWYERMWGLCFERYVDWENGEWRQKLHRDLSPMTGTIALPVKDPFHLPRSLILQIELLENKTPPRVATVS